MGDQIYQLTQSYY